ncbi:hypothetical protein PEp14_00060 [Erwinia phage PEp14]|uniref:Uncharacterized protein n=1 Tax=Erwinia phage PEp14 TaxID=1131315 RepID=H2DE90_9CAUD|nr:hypothetical protein PEp14_00060 [Erwinia phage PEp14]AEY69649.1 hypothetical protein PEp14_00060 [Erwinia phage PEp14]
MNWPCAWAELVNQGHGENLIAIDTHQPMLVGRATHVSVSNVVAGKDWNHGACLLWPSELLIPVSATVPMVDNSLITAAAVERDDEGLWSHPAYPEGIESAEELNEWFALHNLTYTTNYLLPPEGSDTDDYAQWELRQPAGNGWFLWEIRLNQSDEPIAVWAHNL